MLGHTPRMKGREKVVVVVVMVLVMMMVVKVVMVMVMVVVMMIVVKVVVVMVMVTHSICFLRISRNLGQIEGETFDESTVRVIRLSFMYEYLLCLCVLFFDVHTHMHWWHSMQVTKSNNQMNLKQTINRMSKRPVSMYIFACCFGSNL